MSVETPAQGEADVDQPDKSGDLDEGTDHASQGLSRRCAEGRDGHGDRELEVVARSGEGQRRRARVAEPEAASEGEPATPHHGEVHEQWDRDPSDVEGARGDCLALQGEEDDDGEQQAVERPGADLGQEGGLVPGATAPATTETA